MKSTNLHPVIRICGYAAALSLIMVPIAILVVRGGMWREGLMLYGLAGAEALLLLGVFAVLALTPKFKNWRGAIGMRALWCVIPAFLLLSSFFTGASVPAIHDISNNLDAIPEFVTAGTERGTNSNPIEPNPNAAKLQAERYPALTPILSNLPQTEIFAIVLAALKESGLEVYYQDPAQGVIEAVATTNLMLFKDDVIARLRSEGNDTYVDLRSVSRVGRSDFGANFKRLENLTTRINATLSQ